MPLPDGNMLFGFADKLTDEQRDYVDSIFDNQLTIVNTKEDDRMANLYEIFYEHTELRRASVIAESKAEAIDKFHDGDYEEDDGKESLKSLVRSVDLVEENV